MQELNLNKEGKNLYEVFNLTEERGDELSYGVSLVNHDLKAPVKPGESKQELSEIDIFFRYVALAKNESERLYLGFLAGRQAINLVYTGKFSC